MPDQILDCIDCKSQFEHTERDQEFYAERKFTPHKRCRNCRMKKKARMGDSNSLPRNLPPADDFNEFGAREY